MDYEKHLFYRGVMGAIKVLWRCFKGDTVFELLPFCRNVHGYVITLAVISEVPLFNFLIWACSFKKRLYSLFLSSLSFSCKKKKKLGTSPKQPPCWSSEFRLKTIWMFTEDTSNKPPFDSHLADRDCKELSWMGASVFPHAYKC